MENFENIKYNSYSKYAAFSKHLADFRNYSLDIPRSEVATFKLGDCEFQVLPVLRSQRFGSKSHLLLFDVNHPSGLSFAQISEIVTPMKVPSPVPENSSDLISNCFRLSYKLTALVCDKVNGLAFLSATSDDDVWTWFVILKGKNKAANQYLRRVNNEKMTRKDADLWYQFMNF